MSVVYQAFGTSFKSTTGLEYVYIVVFFSDVDIRYKPKFSAVLGLRLGLLFVEVD